MASYDDIFTNSNSAAFLGRLAVAATKFAEYIITEPSATDNHIKRWDWAKAIVKDGGAQAFASRNALIISWDGTIQGVLPAVPTDAQVQGALEAWVNRMLQF
jgi:hypothetical protein